MDKKTKIIISMFSLVLVVVSVLFTFSNIFGSSSGSVGTDFTVNYSAPNGVDAVVSASYYLPNGTEVDLTTTGLPGGSTTVSLNKNTTSCQLSTNNQPNFSVQNYYVIFEFYFKNVSTRGKSMIVSLANSCSSTGSINTYYGKSASKLDSLSSMINCAKAVTPSSVVFAPDTNYYIIPDRELYVYMLLEINDEGFTANASYLSTSANGLLFTLTKVVV